MEKLTKKEQIDLLHIKTGIPKKDINKLFYSLYEIYLEFFLNSEETASITLYGLGTFKKKTYRGRQFYSTIIDDVIFLEERPDLEFQIAPRFKKEIVVNYKEFIDEENL